MEKIESFRVDHTRLLPGLYVSRRDGGDEKPVTTFDIRITQPNMEPVMDMPAIHTMEHLGATFLRNSALKDEIIYFGPMGCRTGFYLITRDVPNEKVLEVTIDVLKKIIAHEGEVFGATRKECGNYLDLDLADAKRECEKYLAVLEGKENDFIYKG